MTRRVRSFEADADVEKMLDRASQNGIKLKHIVNSACREWLTKQGFARKRDMPYRPVR